MIAVPKIETGLSLRSKLLKSSKYSGFKNADCCLDTRLDYIKGSASRGAICTKVSVQIQGCLLRTGAVSRL